MPKHEIEEAELRLGFKLHPLLATVYRDFTNSGSGPDYQSLSSYVNHTGWWDKG